MKIKPTGLKGADKIQRIQNLMGKLNPINESFENSSLEHIKYGPDGIAYGIIRENHTYFIKTSDKNTDKLEAKDFEYIGGLQNKLSESYRSYEDALRHLNMKFKDLNESYNIRENIDLFRADFLTEGSKKKQMNIEQEEEETTFKLKVDAPEEPTTDVPEAPAVSDVPADETSEMPADSTDMGMDSPDMTADKTPEETEVSDEDTDDLEKDIQRLTGKIGQKMRELDEPNPELEKYVINSIMSALDVDSMDEDFKEDLISKLEGEEENSTEEPTEEEPTEEPTEEPEKEEIETEVKSESRVISKKSLIENLKSKKLLKNKLKRTIKESDEFYGRFRDMDDEWIGNLSNKRSKLDDTKDWEEEEFSEYEDFSGKYPKHNWFSGSKNPEGSKMMFKSYKDKFGPFKIKKDRMSKKEEILDEEETMTSYKDLNDFKANYGKLTPKSKFSITGMEGNFMKEVNEEENIYEIELDEDWMEEGNKFTDMLRKTKKGGTFKIGNKTYKDTSSYDDLDEEFEMGDEMGDEKKPLHNKPFDLSSVKSTKEKDLDENYDEFDMDLKDDLMRFSSPEEEEYEEEVLVDPETPISPDEDEPFNPFKPKIKPQIQPKGRMGYDNNRKY